MNLRHEILKNCFGRYEGAHASGEGANNKLDLERIKDNQDLTDFVVRALSKNVLEHNPEFVVGVPDGATWLAGKVARRADLYLVHLKREGKDRTAVRFETWADKDAICEPLSRGVLIEDVFNRFTNTIRSLAIPEINKRIVAAEAIWDRGVQPRKELYLPHRALIEEPIPAVLPEDSELWRYDQPS